MFSQLSNLIPSIKFGFTPQSHPAVTIPPIQIHDLETAQEKPARTLKHLLKLNHSNHSILYNELQFYNHIPHLLSTAYLHGMSAEQLNDLYESESKEQEPWTPSPSEITRDDWREFLSKREYQRAYLDFFEDELVQHGYDWKKVMDIYMFSGKEPLVNSLVAGLGHPLIHLGYAYEMCSRELAMEALAMAATNYDSIYNSIIPDPPSQLLSPPSRKFSAYLPIDILETLRSDTRFDDLFVSPGYSNIFVLLSQHSSLLYEYVHAWLLADNPTNAFRLIQHTATVLFLGTSEKPHDFFFLHLLNSTHALRVLLPIVPPEYHVSLLRQWWLLAIAVYVSQLRPEIKASKIREVELQGRDWEWVRKMCTSGNRAADPHYIKGVRTLGEISKLCGDKAITDDETTEKEFYLKAGIRLIDDFEGWGGFS